VKKNISDKLISWASVLDVNTENQALRTANLPIVEGPVALMANAHYGIGATVGSVIPTKHAIIPSAVGVDIGCGMIAAKLSLTSSELPDNLTDLHNRLRKLIPVGIVNGKNSSVNSPFLKEGLKKLEKMGLPPGLGSSLRSSIQSKIPAQIGTLGSGNHFVEICLDETKNVWLVLHSGSRGIGNILASEHIKIAKKVMKYSDQVLEDPNLAYLLENQPEFQAYINDMLWAQRYAWLNREVMLDNAIFAIKQVLPNTIQVSRINCHHNYAEKEEHFGQEVWITRKGAIKADIQDFGVIPGSMGASSFIVKGKGELSSYRSASHGAGRRLSRKKAKEQLTVESLKDIMSDKYWDKEMASNLLDEHPDAYKDINEVMADQADLVEIVHELRQIVNLKGT
jgi:tRNA-splicing ligase RtcB